MARFRTRSAKPRISRMMVHINGVLQAPGIDYVSTNRSIAFSSPPPSMSTIEISGRNGILARLFADGSTYRYDFMSDMDTDISRMLEEAFNLRYVPAVADALERLQIIVELTKQNDTLHQRG